LYMRRRILVNAHRLSYDALLKMGVGLPPINKSSECY